jgi:HEXXH motif-containing protein
MSAAGIVPTKPFAPRDLCIPLDGSRTAAALLGRAMRVVIEDLLRLGPHAARGEARQRDVAALSVEVRRLSRTAPGAVAALARLPTIGAKLRCLRSAPDARARDAWLGELCATAWLELSLAGALASTARVSAPPEKVVGLGHRVAFAVPPGARGLVIEPGGQVRVEDPTGALAPLAPMAPPPFVVVDRQIVLATIDDNPLAAVEAHPDKSGNAIDLGGRPLEAWTRALSAALAEIERLMPELRAEIDLYVRQLVPVGWFDETHVSASYREAIGTVYLSLHPSTLTLVEALIHEFSHNKLNAMLELDPLLLNDPSERYASPVRPDGRPLLGVLLAVHAFLPVARWYERATALDASPALRRRFDEVRKVNADGAKVLLEHARPTPAGRALLDEIDRLVRYFDGLP